MDVQVNCKSYRKVNDSVFGEIYQVTVACRINFGTEVLGKVSLVENRYGEFERFTGFNRYYSRQIADIIRAYVDGKKPWVRKDVEHEIERQVVVYLSRQPGIGRLSGGAHAQ